MLLLIKEENSPCESGKARVLLTNRQGNLAERWHPNRNFGFVFQLERYAAIYFSQSDAEESA